MSDHWTDRLSEYLDDELEAAVARELDEHLAGCAECRTTLAELRRVVDRARVLEDKPPASDLWAGIAERIGAAESVALVDLQEHRQRKAGLRERRFAFSVPQLAAASIALMMMSAGAGWLVSRGASPAAQDVAASLEPDAALVAAPALGYTGSYATAIAELEQVLVESRDELDETTVRILEENLLIIDRAIAQAERALSLDPANVYLNEHLAATMQQKLDFLRQAARMTGAIS